MKLRHAVEAAAVRGAVAALAPLPDSARLSLGRAVGRIYARFGRRRSEIARRNLRLAFPEKGAAEIERILFACAEHFGSVFFDFLNVTRLAPGQLRERVTVEGLENYFAALDRGKGVFLLSAHLGNWEIGALAAGLLRVPISSVVRPLDNPRLEKALASARGRFGNRTIAKKRAARDVLRELRSGGVVAILIDQNVLAREAVFVPFFGRLAATSPAVGLLQKKTNAAVVPVFCRPSGDGRYDLRFERPVLLSDFPADAAPEELTARYTRVVEEAVRREPGMWLWMHNRWRTRPPGEAS